MVQKKLPSDAKLEDLFSALDGDIQNASILDDGLFESDVLAFLSYYNLSGGKTKIKVDALYKIYSLWSKSPVTKIKFSLHLSLYIPKEKRYYLVNKEISDIISDLSSIIKDRRPPAIRKRTHREHFDAFLKASSLSRGTEWLEAQVIHHFYDKWCFNTKRKKALSCLNFESFLKLCFETRQTKTGLVAKVDHSFNKESIDNLRVLWKRKQKDPK